MNSNFISSGPSLLRYQLPNHSLNITNPAQNLISRFIKKQFRNINDINTIRLEGNHLNYRTLDSKQVEIRKELSPRNVRIVQKILRSNNGNPLTIERDLLSEKIISIAKNQIKKNAIENHFIDLKASNFKNTLYLYSSGGGGHKTAKDAEMERNALLLKNQIAEQLDEVSLAELDGRFKNPVQFIEWCKTMGIIHEADVLHDYLGEIGRWATNQWDEAQKSGNVPKQELLASKQWLTDLLIGPIVFFRTLAYLIKFKPAQIVSTQAMATPSILLAVKIYNSFYKPQGDKEITVHLYMTDMPTEYSSHFFTSLKGLSVIGGKDYLTLHTPKPKNETNWQVLCGLPNGQVKILDTFQLPVRPAFLEAATKIKANADNSDIQIKVSGQEELNILRQTMQDQGCNIDNFDILEEDEAHILNYHLNPDDQGYFMMLGSQPTADAVRGYVERFLTLSHNNPNTNYHLFAFSGKFEKGKSCFYKTLCSYIKEKKINWPANLRVIPLSFQDPAQLVKLELQCHTITRSGGSTVMELLVLDEVRKALKLKQKERFVHAQLVEGRDLIESIPLWERGNFEFLKKQMGATIINHLPEEFNIIA